MLFRLTKVGSSNPVNFINRRSLHLNLLLTMGIDKVEWITVHNCGKLKWHSFTSRLSLKDNILGLNITSQTLL